MKDNDNVRESKESAALIESRFELLLKCIAKNSPHYSCEFQVLVEGLESLFVECALEDDFNSDEPWCVFEILSAIDGVMEGGPFITDASLKNRREEYVLKAYAIVSPLCGNPAGFELLDWMNILSYSCGYNAEAIANKWNDKLMSEDLSSHCLMPQPALLANQS